MMTISKVGRFQAGDYYSKDDYYSRDVTNEDFWYGNALNTELGNNISTDDTNYMDRPRLTAEAYKQTVARMITHSSEATTKLALDLTFSPPKSVSIAALDERYSHDMIMAHNAAVTAVLEKVERELIVWRKRDGQVVTPVKTGNMLAACLQHKVSRDEDPQLHTHVVLFRKTMIDDNIGTIEDSYIYKHQKELSTLYDNALSYQLQCRGYAVKTPVATEEQPVPYGFELAGVPEPMIRHFSHRRQQILKYLREHEMESSGANKELATLRTRQAKKNSDYGALKTEWLTEIQEMGGMQPEHCTKKTDSVLRAEAVHRCMQDAVNELARQEFAFKESDVLVATLRRGLAIGITEPELKKAFNRSVYETFQPMVRRTSDKAVYYTTPENLAIAKKIDSYLIKATHTPPLLPEKIVAEKLATIQATLKYKNGWTLSDGQVAAIQSMATLSTPYAAVQGYAGTGKTTMLRYAKEILDSNHVIVRGMAFTGKAAQAIRDESGIEAQTIHGFLTALTGKPPDSFINSRWDFSQVKPSTAPEVWVVDESSMINDRLLHAILKASDKANAKVVFIGDKGQLLPIGTGNGFARMTESKAIPVVEMKEINRQQDGSHLKRAVEILSGKEPTPVTAAESYLKRDIQEILQRKSRLNRLVTDYLQQTPQERRDSVVLVAKNEDRTAINKKIRTRLKIAGELPDGQTFAVVDARNHKETKEFSVGEKIMFLKNEKYMPTSTGKSEPVMNGQLGEILDIKGDTLRVKTGNETVVTVDTKKYPYIDYAYAMTSHKAQGITVKRAFVYYNSKQASLNSRNKFYVDISRAKEAVFVYTDNTDKMLKQVNQAAKKLTVDDFVPAPPVTRAKGPSTPHPNHTEIPQRNHTETFHYNHPEKKGAITMPDIPDTTYHPHAEGIYYRRRGKLYGSFSWTINKKITSIELTGASQADIQKAADAQLRTAREQANPPIIELKPQVYYQALDNTTLAGRFDYFENGTKKNVVLAGPDRESIMDQAKQFFNKDKELASLQAIEPDKSLSDKLKSAMGFTKENITVITPENNRREQALKQERNMPHER